jgi:hypothetical protein
MKKIFLTLILLVFLSGCIPSFDYEEEDKGDWVCEEYYCYWENEDPFMLCGEPLCFKSDDYEVELIYPESFPQVPLYPNASIETWSKDTDLGTGDESYTIYFYSYGEEEEIIEILTAEFVAEGWDWKGEGGFLELERTLEEFKADINIAVSYSEREELNTIMYNVYLKNL